MQAEERQRAELQAPDGAIDAVEGCWLHLSFMQDVSGSDKCYWNEKSTPEEVDGCMANARVLMTELIGKAQMDCTLESLAIVPGFWQCSGRQAQLHTLR